MREEEWADGLQQ